MPAFATTAIKDAGQTFQAFTGDLNMAISRQNRKIIGLVLTVVGIGLAIWGYRMSGSFSSQLNEALSGSYGDKVMMLYIGGAACFVAGLFMLSKK
jgi:hypothetical protein